MSAQDKLAMLARLCKCEVSVTINGHRNLYQTAEEALANMDALGVNPDLDAEERAAIIAEGRMVEVQFYPHTPIGFQRVIHHDLDVALDIALATAAFGFTNGDYVTRMGDDVHLVRNMAAGDMVADFVCVKAPATGWCKVGDVEPNLCRRYQRVEYTPPPAASAEKASRVEVRVISAEPAGTVVAIIAYEKPITLYHGDTVDLDHDRMVAIVRRASGDTEEVRFRIERPEVREATP